MKRETVKWGGCRNGEEAFNYETPLSWLTLGNRNNIQIIYEKLHWVTNEMHKMCGII